MSRRGQTQAWGSVRCPVSLGISPFSKNPLRHGKTPTVSCEQSHHEEVKVGEVLIHPLCSVPVYNHKYSHITAITNSVHTRVTPPNPNPDDPKLRYFRFCLCKYKCLLLCGSGLQVLNEAQIQECLSQRFSGNHTDFAARTSDV